MLASGILPLSTSCPGAVFCRIPSDLAIFRSILQFIARAPLSRSLGWSRSLDMDRFVFLAACAASALHTLAVRAQDVPPCILGCQDSLKANFAQLGCRNAADAECLCRANDFFYGIRDCGAHCGANDNNVRQFLKAGFCAVIAATPSTLPTPSSPSSMPTSTQGSSAHAPTSALPTTPAVVSIGLVASTSSQPTSSTSADSASSSSKASEAASSPTSAAVGDSGAGLSQASVVGIGVGVGAAVVALAAVVLCFLLRSRKRQPRPSLEISNPLPGSGRAYAGRDGQSYEKSVNEIELSTNRYEDMIPRQQPRTMV